MISIILATFNRAAFLLETLESINNQTFTDFECIVIDDGSTDHTANHIAGFIEMHDRFHYEMRPAHVPKGANYCRNYGYSRSKGSLIKFFDSDDLMLPNHLEVSITQLQTGGYDFVVADCINFNESGLLDRPYEIDRSNAVLNAMNFAQFKTAWITNDLLVKREFANLIQFASGMRDQATEYHYNIHLLLLTQNGFLIDKILTHRRIHDGGIVVSALKDELFFDQMNAESFYRAADQFQRLASPALTRWLLSSHVQLSYKIAKKRTWPEYISHVTQLLIKYSSWKGIIYPIATAVVFTTGKGYSLMKYVRS